MIVTTTFTVEGHEIVEYLGVVRGITVRSPTLVQGFFGGLKRIIGGRIGAYIEMCEQARQHAFDAMIEHAKQLGADAIVGMHYDGSEVGTQDASSEVLCYGTAVRIAKISK